ncbi:MAG TPA: hypothetical protein DDW84_05840 [Phycisphaerales bacterium]|nr:MAG: hypothetical protein A2Y13_10695 [Planctomycetes bacterium GWC2_45_44]HBG78354.1 hypothetical protein [Phycisphaerales bacterium]HBR19926.1 hypothetical protein [Phycisphaerales bacterium]
MATALNITEKEYPSLFEKLERLFKPQNEDDKQSFRNFAVGLLHEICDSKLPQPPQESQEDNLGNSDKKIVEAVNG